MSILLDLFAPYLTFITFFITIIFNLTLVFKKVSWVILIVANIILSLTLNFIGLGSYDLLTQVVEYIVVDILGGLITALGEAISGLFPF